MCCLETLILILGAAAVAIGAWIASLLALPRVAIPAAAIVLAVSVFARNRGH